MKISTETLKNASIGLSSNIRYILFEDAHLNTGHARILNHVQQLSDYFNRSAILLESNESSVSNSFFHDGISKFTHKEDWNGISLLQKKNKAITLTQSYEYSVGQASSSISEKYFSAGVSLDCMDFLGKGKCQFYLWKDELFDPKALLEGSLSFSLLSGNFFARLGTDHIYTNAKARGDVGVIYGNASAVLSSDEQTFKFGGGVAAAKGEVSLAFNVFGASVTLKGTGSVGSAELNMEYSHKNREWELGTNLGFIAGLGFDIKVNY